jgi:hypothetical protein
MSAKCPCQNCNTHLEFDTKDAGQTIACPNCGMDTLLFMPQKPAKPILYETVQAASPPRKLSTKEALREQSAYKTGRTVVGVIFIFSVIGSILSAFGFAAEMATEQTQTIGLVGAASSIASLLLIWAAKELAAAVFDMADCALKKKENSN